MSETWTQQYEANEIPGSATPSWTTISGPFDTESVSGGVLTIAATAPPGEKTYT